MTKTYSEMGLSSDLLDALIYRFADTNGCRQAHKSIHSNIVAVDTRWDDMPADIKSKYVQVAYEIILDFMVWYTTHPHEQERIVPPSMYVDNGQSDGEQTVTALNKIASMLDLLGSDIGHINDNLSTIVRQGGV